MNNNRPADVGGLKLTRVYPVVERICPVGIRVDSCGIVSFAVVDVADDDDDVADDDDDDDDDESDDDDNDRVVVVAVCNDQE